MFFVPHAYQEYARDWIIEKPASALFLDMGLGKTVCTLTALSSLMHDYFKVSKVLVIAPLRVARDTWSSERDKWDQLNYLKISFVIYIFISSTSFFIPSMILYLSVNLEIIS